MKPCVGFTTYKRGDNGEEKEFLTWNMSLIFRKADGQWLLKHGHLSLRDAWDRYNLGRSIRKWRPTVRCGAAHSAAEDGTSPGKHVVLLDDRLTHPPTNTFRRIGQAITGRPRLAREETP